MEVAFQQMKLNCKCPHWEKKYTLDRQAICGQLAQMFPAALPKEARRIYT